jgi:hypothetical protein
MQSMHSSKIRCYCIPSVHLTDIDTEKRINNRIIPTLEQGATVTFPTTIDLP